MTNNSGNIQLTSKGRLKHFLAIADLPKHIVENIITTADSFVSVGKQPIKKVPLLRGKTVMNLFFENSTRTRTTFELAAKRLSADIINLDIQTSSTTKGETLLDTLQTLEAMHADAFVVRHSSSGAAHFIAARVTPNVSIINAGDGRHAHPTQAMLDMLTIYRHKGGFDNFKNLTVVIVGDILHSRVARSQVRALTTLGTKEIRLVAPATLLPEDIADLGASLYTNFDQALKNADVVIMLRLQKERMSSAFLPSEKEFYRYYGLSRERLKLAAPDVAVMHPGPINRGVEIESQVADGPNSLILSQVNYGIATRMAILGMTLGVKLADKD